MKEENVKIYRDLRNTIHESRKTAAEHNVMIRLMEWAELRRKMFSTQKREKDAGLLLAEMVILKDWVINHPDQLSALCTTFMEESAMARSCHCMLRTGLPVSSCPTCTGTGVVSKAHD